MKSVLITGCSSGVGLSLVKKFASRDGYKVHAAVRKITEELKKELLQNSEDRVVLHRMDVCDTEAVRQTVDSIIKNDGKIDILVNNAGYSQFGCVEMLSMDEVQAQFNTNLYGVIRTSQAVLPSMRKNKWGRIINVSSIGGIYGQPFNDIYCASKFALEGLSMSMASLYRQFGIRVVLVEPGAIRTSFVQNAARPDISALDSEFLPYLNSLLKTYETMFQDTSRSQTAEEVAECIFNAAEAEDPAFRIQTNPATKGIYEMILKDPSGRSETDFSERTFFSSLPGKKAD